MQKSIEQKGTGSIPGCHFLGANMEIEDVGYQQNSTILHIIYILSKEFTVCQNEALQRKKDSWKLAGQYKPSQSSLGESEGVVWASQIQNVCGFGAFLGSGATWRGTLLVLDIGCVCVGSYQCYHSKVKTEWQFEGFASACDGNPLISY